MNSILHIIKSKHSCNKSRSLFTNADSLVYENETKNIYDNFNKNIEISDFNNYFAKSNIMMIQTP